MILRSLKKYYDIYRIHKRFRKTVFYANAFADNSSFLGENTVLFQNVQIVSSTLDRYTYVQSNSKIYNSTIGPFCSIASDVTIGLAIHPTDMVSTSPVFYDNTQPLPFFFTDKKLFTNYLPKTVLGADVWIGQGAMIKAGITVGVGAVIGAGEVVTRDIEPYSIVAGVPAQLIRKRFDEDICQRLYNSKWWTLEDQYLKDVAPYFNSPQKLLDFMGGYG